MSDFAVRFGLALIVVIVACAAIIISRRNYAKAAIFEHSIEAFRLEFRRSIDAAQAATIKGVAKTIRDSISSVIKPINSTVRDFNARLARLEQQHADATASHMAGTQILDVRLARLEEHADAGAIQNLDARLARLEKHTDANAIESLDARLAGLEKHTEATATQIAGTQKQSLAENERIAARLIGLEQNLQQNLTALSDQLSLIKQTIDGAAVREQENLTALSDQQQNLTALSDQLSLIKQTIDGAAIREQDIKNSVEAVSSRVLNTQTRVDELFPRLVLGEKAREDLATLIGLFVKRLKNLNANLTETAQRLSDLETEFRSKARQLEERHSSILERMDCPSTSNTENRVKETPKAADGTIPIEANPIEANPIEANPIEANPIEAKTDGENAGVFERPPASKKSSDAANGEGEGRRSDNSRADQHAT